MNKNTLVITIISIVAMVGFLFGAYALTSQPEVTEYEQLKTLRENEHIKWSPAKKTVLIEYSDLQCPACAQYHTVVLKEIEKDKTITDKITFVYRHFPLDSSHPNARKAAYAAEAASKQGKFYEMHDILFENQGDWSGESNPDTKFIGYAKKLKLKEDQFQKDMKSQAAKDIVQNDFISGTDVGVQGTPTFFLNGKKLASPATIEDFKKILLEGAK